MDNARERMRETSGRVPRARGPTATRDARLDGRKFTVRVRINDWKKTDSPFTSLIEIAEERRIADAQRAGIFDDSLRCSRNTRTGHGHG